MLNFSIGYQIQKEVEAFRTTKLRLASLEQQDSVRYLGKEPQGHYFNQGETISLIDLYYNSIFENGPIDKQKQRKIFLNVGKFRTDVSAKQVDIDRKNFIFLPDDYADPFTALFLQKDFKEWAKDSAFGELVNQVVENYPKYGTAVLKKVGKTIKFVPLQNLKNQQDAESLATASHVIEEHPAMTAWELEDMANAGAWNVDNLGLRYDETLDVHERYGYVTLRWYKLQKGLKPADGDENRYVDVMAVVGLRKTEKDPRKAEHVFYVTKANTRPYLEAHWTKQHGRWLGIGTMEDQFENQRAKNLVINLQRRGLSWSTKKVLKTTNGDMAGKNLVRDVADGDILEVGVNGDMSLVDLSSRSNAEFAQMLNEWERNSDQKAFTYEVATGEGLPSGTPFRLGVVLSNAVNSYFELKREKLGQFLKKAVEEFLLPQFIRDMANEDRVIAMFSGEPGFETLKAAAVQYARSQAAKRALLSGEIADASVLDQASQLFQNANALSFKLPKETYAKAKFKFDFTVTGEEIDVAAKVETMKTIYQLLAQKNDPRAEAVLERIAALTGESMARFGPKPQSQPLSPATMDRAKMPALAMPHAATNSPTA